jgi:hypothetical protein
LSERRESHGKIIGERQLPHGIANGQTAKKNKEGNVLPPCALLTVRENVASVAGNPNFNNAMDAQSTL